MAVGLLGLSNCLHSMSTSHFSICCYNSQHFKLNSLLYFHMFIISYQQPQDKICLKWEEQQRIN